MFWLVNTEPDTTDLEFNNQNWKKIIFWKLIFLIFLACFSIFTQFHFVFNKL